MLSQLLDLYPAVTEAGYQCEMSLSDASAALGTASQVVCWLADEHRPWVVCKFDAIFNAVSAIIEQLSLFFGLLVLSSPKPALTYVKMVRYLTVLSCFGSIAIICSNSIAYARGQSFVKDSSACLFDVVSDNEDITDMLTLALDTVVREAMTIVLYAGLIWGTYAIAPVLKSGGTGDERIADSDVLSIVRKNPPKILVLSSFFGVASLRVSALCLCMTALGLAGLNSFNNIWRLSVWCGSFDVEGDWCVWPYGVLSMIEQLLSTALTAYTVMCLVRLGELSKLPPLATPWIGFAMTSFVFTCTSLVICAFKYPSYWMSGMKRDFWAYYARFWISWMIFFLIRSIKLIRFAGGVGWEDEKSAKELIYENLSDEKGNDEGEGSNSGDSLNDILGFSASTAPCQVAFQQEAASSISSGTKSSGIGTPSTTVVMGGSVVAMSAQAVEGLTLGKDGN